MLLPCSSSWIGEYELMNPSWLDACLDVHAGAAVNGEQKQEVQRPECAQKRIADARTPSAIERVRLTHPPRDAAGPGSGPQPFQTRGEARVWLSQLVHRGVSLATAIVVGREQLHLTMRVRGHSLDPFNGSSGVRCGEVQPRYRGGDRGMPAVVLRAARVEVVGRPTKRLVAAAVVLHLVAKLNGLQAIAQDVRDCLCFGDRVLQGALGKVETPDRRPTYRAKKTGELLDLCSRDDGVFRFTSRCSLGIVAGVVRHNAAQAEHAAFPQLSDQPYIPFVGGAQQAWSGGGGHLIAETDEVSGQWHRDLRRELKQDGRRRLRCNDPRKGLRCNDPGKRRKGQSSPEPCAAREKVAAGTHSANAGHGEFSVSHCAGS